MSPSILQAEDTPLQALSKEVKRVNSLLERLITDIKNNKYNLLLLVGIMTSRFMVFAHMAEEYKNTCQLNSQTFNLDIRFLKDCCKNIDVGFWQNMDDFEKKISHKSVFFKSTDLMKTTLNNALQNVFHILSSIDDLVKSLRREVSAHIVKSSIFEAHQLKEEFLNCINVLECAVTVSRDRYVAMPQVEHILPLIQPENPSLVSLPRLPTLVKS